jgi:adenylate cyclase
MLVLLALGPLLWYIPAGDGIQRLSYDLPFPWRNTIATPGVAIIYLDEASSKALGQPANAPWDRSLHTRLLTRLTSDGARAVYYDIIFDAPSPKPGVDEDFAAAISRNGHVILGALLDKSIVQGVSRQEIYPPTPMLLKAAATWGLVGFLPFDPDYAVRRLYVGNEEIPTASWAAAQLLNAPVTRNPDNRALQRWLNYYGPPGSFASVSFYQALQADGVAPGFFKDRVVFIGGRPVVGALSASREEFANPYSRWGRLFFNGVEIHATEFLNLIRGDWLTRMPSGIELSLLLAIGLVVAFAANVLSPGRMLLVGITISLLVTCTAFVLEWHQHIWFDWVVPAALVAPAGIIWCAGSQYFEEARKRAALRNAFALYLSPHMADRIANSDFDLKPGGKLVEATVVFTDCKNFTAMSEELNDPVKVSETLIAYFTETSRCVLENDGTIIKYIGDSVMAAWGAPVEEKDHPYKAACAALQMREASKIVVLGRALRTRIGVASGPVVAGNLGSPYRFDYTLIGDTTNFASRLESLNKFVNTSILISDSTQKQLGDRFITRLVGHFALAGKSQQLPIHELICTVSEPAAEGHRKWNVIFAEAIDAIKTGAFEQAKGLFRKTIWERGGEDGPSEFYLKKMAQLEKENALQEWTGVVRLSEK